MRTILLVLGGLAVLLVAAPVAAHGNYLAVDAQTSTDGTVVVEVLTHVVDGFLAVHAGANGGPGTVVGHTDPGEGPLATDLDVRIEPGYWGNVTGNVTVWVAFHRDEGEDGFDPDEDPIQVDASGDRVAERIAVGKRGDRSLVLAESTHEHDVNASRVTVRRVELAEPGYLVLRGNDDGSPGTVVGTRALDSGVHRNVTVDVDDDFYHDREKRFSLWAVLHHSDGDGRFDPATDRPVTVGDAVVRSRFDLRRTGDIEHGHDHGTPTPTPTATPTPTPTPAATPSPTPAAATDSPTPSPSPDRTGTPTPGSVTTTPTTAGGGGPGLGVGATLAAAIAAFVGLARRRS